MVFTFSLRWLFAFSKERTCWDRVWTRSSSSNRAFCTVEQSSCQEKKNQHISWESHIHHFRIWLIVCFFPAFSFLDAKQPCLKRLKGKCTVGLSTAYSQNRGAPRNVWSDDSRTGGWAGDPNISLLNYMNVMLCLFLLSHLKIGQWLLAIYLRVVGLFPWAEKCT